MLALIFVIPFTIVIVIISLHFQQRWKYRSLRSIPEVPQYPLVGSVLEIGLNPVEKLKDFSRFAEKYGPVVRFGVGPTSLYLLITDPELTEFFLSSPKFITKSIDYDLLRPWVGNGLLTSTGTQWQKRRKVITPTFHFKILDEFIPMFNSGADILVERLNKEVGKSLVDIYPFITAFTLDSICDTAMGITVDAQTKEENEYVKAVQTVGSIFIDRTFSGWKQFDFLFRFASEYRDHVKGLDILHGFTRSVIQKRRELLMNTNSDKSKSNEDDFGMKKKQVFLDLLLSSTIDGKPLTDDDITEEVDTFMFEGHDTTASTIAFGLYEMSKHPDIQNKVYKEIVEVLGHDKNVNPTLHDLNNLKYLEAVIKETLRLYPSVPLIARGLQQDVTHKGILYPKGLQLSFFFYYMHRRQDLFKNANSFIPERFLDQNEGRCSNPFAYVPFSAGPRNCIGQKFAMFETKVCLIKVIHNFEILPVDPKHKIILSMETILKSVTGVPIRLQKRN